MGEGGGGVGIGEDGGDTAEGVIGCVSLGGGEAVEIGEAAAELADGADKVGEWGVAAEIVGV